MAYKIYFPISALSGRLGLSERQLVSAANVSRMSVRQVKKGVGNLGLNLISSLTSFFGLNLTVIASPESTASDFSTVATAYKVERDGFESWKIHFMDFVDEFRRTLDPLLILLPPHSDLDRRLSALLASLVRYLCEESSLTPPAWSTKRYYLSSPWFPSQTEALKASAIMESPSAFRSNNIFVQENFAARV